MREDNIKKYYDGVYNYMLFLENIIYGVDNEVKLDKQYINSAIMGFVSNIFLIIKEGIVLKKGDNYDILILEEILEENINLIATKCDDGYLIDGYKFKDKGTLINELRNKIGHGNYEFDLEHNNIILTVYNNKININIKKLSCFVVSSLNSYLKNYKTNEFSRKMVINNKILSNRKKPMLTKSELVGFIKKCKQKVITIKSNDNNIIPIHIIKQFEDIVNEYISSSNEKELYNNISNFNKIFGDNYQIINESKGFKNIDYDTFVPYILNIMNESTSYRVQCEILLRELERNESINNNKLSLLVDNLNNLIILDSINKCNSIDFDKISLLIKKYGNFYLSSYTLVSSLITCFNALFSYGKDNIYVNTNKYTSLDNEGLDYSKLDMSFINIELCNIDMGYINNIENNMNNKYNCIRKIDNKILKMNDNIENAKDVEAVKIIKNNLNDLIDKKIILENKYSNLVEEYNNANKYIKDNNVYLVNERIIDGIRNSIAHGNYYIEYNVDINNSIIVFEDIYNGVLGFKCSVKIIDFISFLNSNSSIIFNFIYNKVKVLNK